MPVIKVEQFGGVDVLQSIDRPAPSPGPGQLTVNVKAAGINFADVMARAGKYPGVPSAPFYPGLETAGFVREVGANVTGFAVGDRVIGLVRDGGYASVSLVEAQRAVKIPETLDFGAASALLVQGLTAYFLLHHGHVGEGKSVLISSASGGLGSLAVQIAKIKGAAKVIGLASQHKHDRVKSLGADAAVDYTKLGWSKEVLAATDGSGVDIYLDSSGDLAGEGFDALGSGSHWIIYGGQSSTGQPLSAQRLGPIIGKSISLRGYTVYFDMPRWNDALTELIGWATEGKLQIDVESYPLARAAGAHRDIEARKTSGKVVLVP